MKRIISGIVLIIFAILVVVPGGIVTWAACTVVALLGLFEIYRVFGIEKKLAGIAGYILLIVYYCLLRVELSHGLAAWLALTALVFLSLFVVKYQKYNIEQIMAGPFGLFYVGFLMSHLYLLRDMENGLVMLGLVFMASCGCDISAYTFGSLFGKHKLIPKVSPNKSVEGAVAGVLGAIVIAAVYALCCRKWLPYFTNPVVACCLICGIASVFSQFGDLAASAIKRQKGIKDYGNLIPGHGGVMDRMDSIIFTAPVVYYVCLILSKIM